MNELVRSAAALVRRIGAVPALARLVVATASTVAVLATALPGWDVPNIWLIVAVLTGLAWVAAPDSGAGLLFMMMVAVSWATGAPSGVSPAAVVTALALLVAHVAAALAASMPITAAADRATALRWLRPTAVIAAVVIGAALLLAALDAWSPSGSVALTLAALTIVATAAWWWSATDDGPT